MAAQKAAPVDLQVKSIEGSDGGTGQLSLRVADPTKSKGLVHRHVVLIQQNARQVKPTSYLAWATLQASSSVTAE